MYFVRKSNVVEKKRFTNGLTISFPQRPGVEKTAHRIETLTLR